MKSFFAASLLLYTQYILGQTEMHLKNGTVIKSPINIALIRSNMHYIFYHSIQEPDSIAIADVRHIKKPDNPKAEKWMRNLLVDCDSSHTGDIVIYYKSKDKLSIQFTELKFYDGDKKNELRTFTDMFPKVTEASGIYNVIQGEYAYMVYQKKKFIKRGSITVRQCGVSEITL